MSTEEKIDEEKLPAPPPDMLDSAALSIEGMISPLPAPDYIKVSAQAFVDSLKHWASEIREREAR